MLLPLLVLLASSFTALAEEDPTTNFDSLPTYIDEVMEAFARSQAGAEAVDWVGMARSVTDHLRALDKYGRDTQKFAAVCWHHTGSDGPDGADYFPGHSFGTALGVCNANPPPPECWETGGAVGVTLPDPSDQSRSSACVVFFSPREETLLGGMTATAFTQQAYRTAQGCIDDPVARHEIGAIDLSFLTACMGAGQMTTDGQDHGPPRAVIAVPHDAAPGRPPRSAPDGHILTLDFHVEEVEEDNVLGPYLWLFALPPASPRQR